jgi:N6-adenosine-specific RNA methylase IME4
MKRYGCIVADPPWAYEAGWPAVSSSPRTSEKTRFASVANNRHGLDPRSRRDLPYDSLSLNEIRALPVADLAADDAHLLLWTTNRYVIDAYDVAKSWGFRPSQLLTWCKSRRGLGPGGVFANTSEFIVYARRGKPTHTVRQDSTWWEWPRGPHSAKPDASLDLVEQTFPGPYLEMFARRARFGWDYWGDQSLGTAEIAA